MPKLKTSGRGARRIAVVIAAALAAVAGSLSSPANAATQISASLGLYVNGTTNAWDNAWVNVRLPMNQYDAQGYIDNGAQIEIRCWGDDTFFDDDLFLDDKYVFTGDGTGRYWVPGSEILVTGVNRLYADAYGVQLTAVISYRHNSGPNWPFTGFNEDGFPDSDLDEIYCNALWTDGDGGRLGAFTGVVKGYF